MDTTFYAHSIHETGGQQCEQREDKLILYTHVYMKFQNDALQDAVFYVNIFTKSFS